jgi:predicted aminopeptidase
MQWIEQRQGSAGVAAYVQRQKEWRSMISLLLSTRSALSHVYETDLDDAIRYREKAAVLDRATACYQLYRDRLGAGRFDAVMARVNNAYLVSLATYQDNVPAFARMFAQLDGNWQAFYAAVAELGRLPGEARSARLKELRKQHIAYAGDDQHAEQIQCESLPGHGFDGEAAGAEHDDVRRGSHG